MGLLLCWAQWCPLLCLTQGRLLMALQEATPGVPAARLPAAAAAALRLGCRLLRPRQPPWRSAFLVWDCGKLEQQMLCLYQRCRGHVLLHCCCGNTPSDEPGQALPDATLSKHPDAAAPAAPHLPFVYSTSRKRLHAMGSLS